MTIYEKKKPRRSQAERSAASSSAILEAAVALFFEEGTRASMMEIGRRSGFSHGLVMARFGSKDGLIIAVTHEIHRRFRAEVFDILEGKTGLAALDGFVDAYCSALRGPSSLSANAFFVLLGEALGPNMQVRQAFAELDTTLRDMLAVMIEEGKAAGEIRADLPTEGVVVLLAGMLRGIGIQSRINPGAIDIEAARHAAHHLVRASIRP